jgi:flagellar motor switch protein FliN
MSTVTAAAPGGFMDIELSLEVWLASEKVPLEQLLALEPGGVLPLSKSPDDPVDLVLNGSVVASGELVVVDGKLGFRVTRTVMQKLASVEPRPAAKEGA